MTQRGFWRTMREENRRAILSDYGVINQVHYLFPQGGGPGGSYSTFADLKGQLRSRDIVLMSGVLREQDCEMPENVYEVTFLGAANRPRQATNDGVATGGGATWMAPASGATTAPLIEVIRQGTTFENILFNPPTNAAAIRLTTAGGLAEAGQMTFRDCSILGGGTGQIGIEDNGGSGFVIVEDSEFILLTGTALLGLSTANAVPQGWIVRNNTFRQNTNDIKMSLNYAQILDNRFMTAGSGATNKVISTTFLSSQGGNNHILRNQFTNTEAQIAPGSGFTGAASDVWSNYVTDQAALAIGQPA